MISAYTVGWNQFRVLLLELLNLKCKFPNDIVCCKSPTNYTLYTICYVQYLHGIYLEAAQHPV